MKVDKTKWKKRTIAEIGDIITGSTPATKDANNYNTNDVCFFKPGDITENTLNSLNVSADYLSYNGYENSRKLPIGSILVTCIGIIGKVGITNVVSSCNQQINAIICNKNYYNRFIAYNILYIKDYLSKKANGPVVPLINKSTFSKFSLNLPETFDEQYNIALELDAVQTMIDEYTAQITDLNNLAKSIFYNMFGDPVFNEKGWQITKLKNVTKLITNGNTPKGGEKVYVDEGIMFFRSQNVWRNELKLDDIAYIDEETNSSLKSSILHHNDILITKTGRINTENSSLGRPALFMGEDNTANINGHVYLVRLTDQVNPIYYLHALLSDSFKELIRNVCVGAIDKRQLNRTHIEDFPVMLAPREMQEKFASLVGAIEKQKALLREQLADAEQLMAERMQYYFS